VAAEPMLSGEAVDCVGKRGVVLAAAIIDLVKKQMHSPLALTVSSYAAEYFILSPLQN